MKKLTLEKAIYYHRWMWREFAETGFRSKEDTDAYKEFKRTYGYEPEDDCFLCEYVGQNWNGKSCEHCPLEWGTDRCDDIADGYYYKWNSVTSGEERKKYAAIIAELPVKEDEK